MKNLNLTTAMCKESKFLTNAHNIIEIIDDHKKFSLTVIQNKQYKLLNSNLKD